MLNKIKFDTVDDKLAALKAADGDTMDIDALDRIIGTAKKGSDALGAEGDAAVADASAGLTGDIPTGKSVTDQIMSAIKQQNTSATQENGGTVLRGFSSDRALNSLDSDTRNKILSGLARSNSSTARSGAMTKLNAYLQATASGKMSEDELGNILGRALKTAAQKK